MKNTERTPIFNHTEKKSIFSLSGVLFFRMFSIFLLLPVFSVLALDLEEATPFLIGVSFGAYGLTQGFLQLPFGIWSDRVGRKKVIVIGLVLFIIGNLLAAAADSIYLMIIARFLQGTGAISSTVFALVADLTRPEVRTRANAAMGVSIGTAFASAFLVAPFLGEWLGLGGMFGMIAFFSLISLVLVLSTVPNPKAIPMMPGNKSFLEMTKTVCRVPSLRTICWGGFVCGTGLSSMFFLIPIILINYGYERGEMWEIYLPMMFAGALMMILASVFAEVRNRFREVMLFGVFLLLLSAFALVIGQDQKMLFWFVAALFLFFMGFNIFEPIFPSLVTRASTAETKGTAMGVYNFAQFFGHFTGATLAGALYLSHFNIFVLLIVLAELWFFFLTLSFTNPEKSIKKI